MVSFWFVVFNFPRKSNIKNISWRYEDAIKNYSNFKNMNIKISENGSLNFPDNGEGWIRDEPLEYIVSSRNNDDFNMFSFDGLINYFKNIFIYIGNSNKQFISRHQRFYKHDWKSTKKTSKWIPKAGVADYSKDVIEKPDYFDINLNNNSHFKVLGYDRPMRSNIIVTDLIRSYLGSGGEIIVNEEVKNINGSIGNKFIVTKSGKTFKASKVILSSGKWLSALLKDRSNIKVMASPLLVTYPAVTKHHFVRMTPFMDKTINHIHHKINGHMYSVIGGGDYANPENEEDMQRTLNNLKLKARDVFLNTINLKF